MHNKMDSKAFILLVGQYPMTDILKKPGCDCQIFTLSCCSLPITTWIKCCFVFNLELKFTKLSNSVTAVFSFLFSKPVKSST